MQHSLTYYERVLARAHPAYLSFLDVSQSRAKAGSVNAVLWLSGISVCIVCMQVVIGAVTFSHERSTNDFHDHIGVFSMNVHLPGNRRVSLHGEHIGVFHWFGGVICIEAAITFIFILVVR
jgi:hypothetical protein